MDTCVIFGHEHHTADSALSLSEKLDQLSNQTWTTQNWCTGIHISVCVLTTKRKSIQITSLLMTWFDLSAILFACCDFFFFFQMWQRIYFIIFKLNSFCHNSIFKPQRLKCQRKEPCKLFTVRKRQEQVDEVNTNVLCQCPRNYRCPKLHTDVGVILGKSYVEDNIRTFSGYCLQDIHWTQQRWFSFMLIFVK